MEHLFCFPNALTPIPTAPHEVRPLTHLISSVTPNPAGFSKIQECDNQYSVFKEPEVVSSEQ